MSTSMSQMVEALESAWRAIQEQHPDVPDAMIVIGPAKSQRNLGHWARDSWDSKDGGDRVHECFVSADRLERDAEDVFGTVLHEAAHALATARDEKDHSGQYHNGTFRKNATAMGMTVEKMRGRGWANTTVTDETLVLYGKTITAIASAILNFRDPVRVAVDPEKRRKAKLSSAKSQMRFLAREEPAVLAEALAGIVEADPEILPRIVEGLRLRCKSCGGGDIGEES